MRKAKVKGFANKFLSLRTITRRFLQLAVSLRYGARLTAIASEDDWKAIANPKRILILNCSHVGDVVISSSIIPVLRSAYPLASIGFATGSWAQMVLRNHPEINHLHCVDHWWPNRNPEGFFEKVMRYRKSRRNALNEIRHVKYDMALCIYPYFIPDLMDLAWQANIPVRVAFSRSLYASLATHLAEIPSGPFLHQSSIQSAILKPLGLTRDHLQCLRASLPKPSPEGNAELLSLLRVRSFRDEEFSVIHMGSGAPNRELPPSFWREVAVRISKYQKVVFTGKGQREESNAEQAIRELPNCFNACNHLSWNGFLAAVTHASVLYGVESMAGHVAAAVGTPCVVAYTGTSGVGRWRPDGEDVTVFTRHLECAPCNKLKGCSQMTCLRSISPTEILSSRELGRKAKVAEADIEYAQEEERNISNSQLNSLPRKS